MTYFMTKERLINIAREYAELPEDESKIKYDCINRSSRLTFYNTVNHVILNRDSQYYTTVTLTGNVLEIRASTTEPFKDTWYKTIEL